MQKSEKSTLQTLLLATYSLSNTKFKELPVQPSIILPFLCGLPQKQKGWIWFVQREIAWLGKEVRAGLGKVSVRLGQVQ